jgi:hypothetical protein
LTIFGFIFLVIAFKLKSAPAVWNGIAPSHAKFGQSSKHFAAIDPSPHTLIATVMLMLFSFCIHELYVEKGASTLGKFCD